MSDEVIDLQPWGYAIGYYMRPAGCAACGCDLWQVDRYSYRCCPCAYAAREKHIAEQAAKPVEAVIALPTREHIEALADAMSSVLDEMGTAHQSVCLYTKAKARIAYEPFMSMMEDDYEFYLPLDEAQRIVKDCDDGR